MRRDLLTMESNTRVVNIKRKEPYDVYIGRPSPFENPFKINRDGDRDKVITLYRNYFYKRLVVDPDFKDRILALKGKVLGCYCAPFKCHGDIIVEYLDKEKVDAQR